MDSNNFKYNAQLRKKILNKFIQMDLSTFATYDKKESLLLNIAKSNQEIVENTHSKPQETLEFKMTKQKESSHLMFLSN